MQTADFYSSATGTLRVNGGRDENAPAGVSLSIDDLSYIKQGSRANEESGSGFTPTEAQLAAMNSGITSSDVAQITTNKNNISTLTEKLQGKNVLSQYAGATSNTYTYAINKDDFGDRGIGIYIIYICNWSTIPNVSIYVAAYSGGVITQSTIAKIAGNNVNISLSNGVISYTGDGYFTVSAIK